MERRTFLKNAATISSFTILRPEIVFGSRANSAIRMGVIGCGNRGTAVISSIVENTNSNIVAIADIFEDKHNQDKHLFILNYTPGPPDKFSHAASDSIIEFVHQLQNVFADYMKSELEINIDPYNFQFASHP